jgi:protein involved in polysaccharide export with SLBB domain
MLKIFRAIVFLAIINLPLYGAIIRAGHVINIQVMSNPEFSGQYIVNENGTIEYPLLADQIITNITTSELMNELTLRLARHIDNPLVLVSIVEKPEITLTVLGQVLNPGPVKAIQGATIQEAIKLAGGALEKADLSRVKIVHKGNPSSEEVYDLLKFMEEGELETMPKLENEDMVVVLAQERSKKVKVIGSVQKPGLFDLEEKMNVFEVIYLAGGPVEKADLTKVRRISHHENSKAIEEVLDIQSYIDKGQMEQIPAVYEGDIIIVYSKWYDWKTILSILNNTLLFIVTIQTFANLFK